MQRIVGVTSFPTRRALSRSVLGFKQSSFHHVEIALRTLLACWSLRFPSTRHTLVPARLSVTGETLGMPPFPEEAGDCSPLR